MSNLLNEMSEILGGTFVDQAKIDPTKPHDVAGGFIVQGVTALDEAILNSIAELTWEQIAQLAMLATIGPVDFQTLTSALSEGVPVFRQAWNAMVEDSAIAHYVDRGSFVLLAKACSQVESYARYVYWCMNVLGEADEATKASLIEKSPAVKDIIPSGETQAQHDKNSNAADKYLGKQFVEPYERADKDAFMAKKLKQVKDIGDAMAKVAAKMGKAPDEVFPNAYSIDLARERARNS